MVEAGRNLDLSEEPLRTQGGGKLRPEELKGSRLPLAGRQLDAVVEATEEAGLGNELWGTGAALGDVDRDGDLDLYVANYVRFDLEAPPDGGRRAVYDGVEVACAVDTASGLPLAHQQ